MLREPSFLAEKASEIRRDVVRMIGLARSGRLASSLSIVDILAWLYWDVLSIDPADPWFESRDRFVLSKGRGAPALYATLANRKFFERDELWSYRRLGAMLQGYPQALRIPGVDAPGGGSFGMGLGIANGLAIALRRGRSPCRVFCLAGEEELQEGAFWEAVIAASRFCLDSICLVIDRYRTKEEAGIPSASDEAFCEKIRSFGWTAEACDGHDFSSLEGALRLLGQGAGRPKCLLARTRLGKGVSFLEGDSSGESEVLDRERVDKALRELEKEEDPL